MVTEYRSWRSEHKHNTFTPVELVLYENKLRLRYAGSLFWVDFLSKENKKKRGGEREQESDKKEAKFERAIIERYK